MTCGMLNLRTEGANVCHVVAVLLGMGLLMEARVRRDFLLDQRAPPEQLGKLWRHVLPLMGIVLGTCPAQQTAASDVTAD